jgi:hypothetical protein
MNDVSPSIYAPPAQLPVASGTAISALLPWRVHRGENLCVAPGENKIRKEEKKVGMRQLTKHSSVADEG